MAIPADYANPYGIQPKPRTLAVVTPPAQTSNTQTSTQTTTTTKAAGKADPALAKQQADMIAAYNRFIAQYQAQARQLRAPAVGAQMKALQGFYPDYSGNILTDIQLRRNANQDVMGIIGPQLKAISDLYTRRSAQGTSAIKDLTGDYFGRLQDQASATASAGAANLAQQQGLDAALANFSRDRNAQMPELQAAAATMGDPNLTAATVGQNQALGNTGAVNVAALGTSSLQRMAADNRAQNAFAALQPGFASQEGQQQLGAFQSQIGEMMQTDIGDIRAKMPELVNQVYSTLINNNNTQRSLAAQRGQTLAGAYGDAQTNALNSRIAQAAVLQNLASMTGGSISDLLSAMNASATNAAGKTITKTTTTTPIEPGTDADPYKIVGEAADALQARLYLDPKFNVEAYNANKNLHLDPNAPPGAENAYKLHPWSWWNPKLALKRIEGQLRTQTKGKVPEKLIHQRAQAAEAKQGYVPPTGNLPTMPGAGGQGGGGIDWGAILRGIPGINIGTPLWP
jgi:hypothetical protein